MILSTARLTGRLYDFSLHGREPDRGHWPSHRRLLWSAGLESRLLALSSALLPRPWRWRHIFGRISLHFLDIAASTTGGRVPVPRPPIDRERTRRARASGCRY